MFILYIPAHDSIFIFYVMELCVCSLYDALKAHHVEELSKKKSVIQQVITGLKFVHGYVIYVIYLETFLSIYLSSM